MLKSHCWELWGQLQGLEGPCLPVRAARAVPGPCTQAVLLGLGIGRPVPSFSPLARVDQLQGVPLGVPPGPAIFLGSAHSSSPGSVCEGKHQEGGGRLFSCVCALPPDLEGRRARGTAAEAGEPRAGGTFGGHVSSGPAGGPQALQGQGGTPHGPGDVDAGPRRTPAPGQQPWASLP